MKDRKGFTLVELLAVIVILAIIMIIAIPSVLGTLETARRKTFVEYITRVFEAGQNQYLTQLSSGTLPDKACVMSDTHNGACYVENDGKQYFYEIQSDLGLSSTGSYKGFVAIVPSANSSTETQIFVGLYDTNYMTSTYVKNGDEEVKHKYYINYTLYGEPNSDELVAYNEDRVAAIEARYKGIVAENEIPWGINDKLVNKVSANERE